MSVRIERASTQIGQKVKKAQLKLAGGKGITCGSASWVVSPPQRPSLEKGKEKEKPTRTHLRVRAKSPRRNKPCGAQRTKHFTSCQTGEKWPKRKKRVEQRLRKAVKKTLTVLDVVSGGGGYPEKHEKGEMIG